MLYQLLQKNCFIYFKILNKTRGILIDQYQLQVLGFTDDLNILNESSLNSKGYDKCYYGS